MDLLTEIGADCVAPVAGRCYHRRHAQGLEESGHGILVDSARRNHAAGSRLFDSFFSAFSWNAHGRSDASDELAVMGAALVGDGRGV